MTQSIEGLKYPLVSVDPNKHVVEEGFPLYLSKNRNQFVQYFPEEQVIERTNDFRPACRKKKKLIKPSVNKIYSDAPEFADISRKDLRKIVSEDEVVSRKFEHQDPLKGNSLAVSAYLDAFELYAFGAGPSMSHLVLLVSEKKELGTADTVIHITETVDLKYPIRQINLSPLSTLRHIVFAVRTTSTIHLFKYNHEGKLGRLHYLNLAERTMLDARIDYSMPIHVEMSPYNKYDYCYTTTNGYTSLVDAAQDKVIFADIDPVPKDTNYLSQWRSCAFGKTPISLLLASPACIKEWHYSNHAIQSTNLATSNDRIVAFKTCHASQVYCFATVDSIVFMDTKRPESPVITWLHGMNDELPWTLFLQDLSDHNWRIIAFSNQTQRASMTEFRYVNNPLQSMAPTVKVIGLYQMPLPIYYFNDLYDQKDQIRSMGITFNIRAAKNNDTTKGYMMCSFTRLFEDGSIKVQNLALSPDKSETIQIEKPRFIIESSPARFNDMLKESKLAMLPARQGRALNDAELCSVRMDNFQSYLENVVECGLATLTESFKTEVASRLRQLKVPTVFCELFEDYTYQNYDLGDLEGFLNQMETHEDIERGRQITIPGVSHHGKPVDKDLNRKLRDAYEKLTRLSKIIIHPLPQHQDDPHTFHYLGRQDVNFTSTTTTKVLSHLWSIDDDTKFDDLAFHQYNTSTPLEPEKFPSVNVSNKRRHSSPKVSIDLEQCKQEPDTAMSVVVTATSSIKKKKAVGSIPRKPAAASTQHQGQGSPHVDNAASAFAQVSTQPVPGAFASRKKSAQKKKKVKSSGFK